MSLRIRLGAFALILLAALNYPASRPAESQTLPAGQWSIAYWSPFGHPSCPISDIEWDALTHLVHYAALVNPDGTLDLETEEFSRNAPALILAAHTSGVKVLLNVSQQYWRGQTTNLKQAASDHLTTLVSGIMKAVDTYGYDGVDIDWEPFAAGTDGPAMASLSSALRARLGTRILTAAAIVIDYRYWGSVQAQFDRINVMTYDQTGTWCPYSWHNAALYDQDARVWSVNLAVERFTARGVPAYKLGIGIPLFGYQWSGGGITGPRQHWTGKPSVEQKNYQAIAPAIPRLTYGWDSQAMVPYLSGTNQFVTYDNEQSIRDKVNYARVNNLGGWIIWEVCGDYFPNQNPKHPLLAAIKDARKP